MENPATWGPLEQAISQSRLRHSMTVRRGETLPHAIVKSLYHQGHVLQHDAEEAERVVSHKLSEMDDVRRKEPGRAGLSYDRQIADALRAAKVVQEKAWDEIRED